ncbi:exosome complex component RRP4 [Methanohalophilus levihalophilus]|uniref:exosome complex RNA-binding protein Rrp4 n=1 Tax=Methanohalophilus levihalophilus TaxID=1431282 RepID=UPI001AE8D4B3|nr:exosome complex RNA-binding protein Rrp4 [Methanohalophilus levihalophilus]MBP2029411.1 exosome complex component RRP4 [Methanohalophilus levihalophilus]
MDRKIVFPGQLLSEKASDSGKGTYVKNGKVYSLFYGVANLKNKASVVPFSGRYSPHARDQVIGKVIEVTSSNWIFEIGAPYDGLLHVSEYPRRVDNSMMRKTMDIGDSAILRIKDVSAFKKVELTMRDHGLRVLRRGRIIEVQPAKVPRIIGHSGSMVSILKRETNCDIFIGQNGRIWINGKDADMERLSEAIRIIERESHTSGLTDRISHFLKGDEEDSEVVEELEVAEEEPEEVEELIPEEDEEEEMEEEVLSPDEVGYTEDACRKMDVLLDDEKQ